MKYLLNVDLLEFRASTEIHLNNFLSNGIYKFSNGLSLVKVKDYRNVKQSYSYCFKMWYKNNDIGLLYSKALDLAFSSGFNTLLRIDNKVFYTDNIVLILKTLVEALGLTETKIKRLDIAYDTNIDVLSNFKTLFYDESTKFRLRKNFNKTGTGKDDETTYIGSITGKKCIAIYNKTLEINKKSHKEYIREIHRKVLGYKNIYRVELRIKERTEEIKDIDIMRLDQSEYLETIFNTYFDDLVQFSDINTKEKIEFIKINNTGEKLIRVKRQKGNDGGKYMMGIINLLDKESKSKEFRGNIKAVNLVKSILLKKYGLETWYKVRNKGLIN